MVQLRFCSEFCYIDKCIFDQKSIVSFKDYLQKILICFEMTSVDFTAQRPDFTSLRVELNKFITRLYKLNKFMTKLYK